MSRKRYGESRNRKQPTWRQATAKPDILENVSADEMAADIMEVEEILADDIASSIVSVDDMPVDLQAAAFDYIATGKIADDADPDEVRDVARSILNGTYF